MALTTKFVKNTNFNIPTVSYASSGTVNGFLPGGGYQSIYSYLSSSTFASSIVLYTVPSGRTAKLTLNPMISIGTTPGVSYSDQVSLYFSMSSFGGSSSKWMYQAHIRQLYNYCSTLLYINDALIFSTSTSMFTQPITTSFFWSSGAGISNFVSSVTSNIAGNSSIVSPSIFNRSEGMMHHYLGANNSIALYYGGVINDYLYISVSYYTTAGSGASFYQNWSYSALFNDIHTSILSFITIEESAL